MKSIKSEKGASLVEFVLVLPLLVMFLFAIIEFSVLMYDKAVVSLGSREGARAAVVWRPTSSAFLDTAAIKTEIDNFLGVVGANPPTRLISFGDKTTALKAYKIKWAEFKDDPDVDWDAAGYDPDTHNYMKVVVEYRYDFMVLDALSFMGLPSSITISGETIMRMEKAS